MAKDNGLLEPDGSTGTFDILERMQEALGWHYEDMDPVGEPTKPMGDLSPLTEVPADAGRIMHWNYGSDVTAIAPFYHQKSGWSGWVELRPTWPLDNTTRASVHLHKPGDPVPPLPEGVPIVASKLCLHKAVAMSITIENRNLTVMFGEHSTNRADIQPDFSRPTYDEKWVLTDFFPA